jgi:indole-3-glycerol phosphate synthase
MEVEAHKKQLPLNELMRVQRKPRDFAKALANDRLNIIAEIKKASPSKGIIRKEFDYLSIADIYEKNGAAAISVLTEEKYFLGNLNILQEVANKVNIPVLRKDFIIDAYQIYEASYFGADAILLIVALLSKSRLSEFISLAGRLNLAVLVEVHNETELQTASECGAAIIGINNRDLKSFNVDLETTFRLIKLIRNEKCIIVSESGIRNREDALRMKKAGLNAVLIGETLMRSNDIGNDLKEFII